MTRASKIVCRNQFKNADVEVSKTEFNRKMALLINRMEDLTATSSSGRSLDTLSASSHQVQAVKQTITKNGV